MSSPSAIHVSQPPRYRIIAPDDLTFYAPLDEEVGPPA